MIFFFGELNGNSVFCIVHVSSLLNTHELSFDIFYCLVLGKKKYVNV